MRYAFAAAVGKRFYSERVASTAKTAIIEHHRSVNWAQNEYMNLSNIVQVSAWAHNLASPSVAAQWRAW